MFLRAAAAGRSTRISARRALKGEPLISFAPRAPENHADIASFSCSIDTIITKRCAIGQDGGSKREVWGYAYRRAMSV
jgi:hypothetical protein